MKKRTAERQRIKREIAEMMLEDELGKAMQLEDMRLRQEAQMKNELAFDDVSSSSDDGEGDREKMKMKTKTVLITTLKKALRMKMRKTPAVDATLYDEVFETKIQQSKIEMHCTNKRKIRRKKRLGNRLQPAIDPN